MPKDWQSAVARSEEYEESDFMEAMYMIMAHQVIYQKDNRIQYTIIDRHKEEFREAVALAGYELKFDADYGFCYIIPTYLKNMQPMSMADTRLILVLRKVYHEKFSLGEFDGGDVIVSLPELQSAYQATTGEKKEFRSTDLRSAIDRLKRFGMTRIVDSDDDEQPFSIVIRPAIARLVSDAALSQLHAHLASVIETEHLEDVEEEEESAYVGN